VVLIEVLPVVLIEAPIIMAPIMVLRRSSS
jgi:hypothetical protein